MHPTNLTKFLVPTKSAYTPKYTVALDKSQIVICEITYTDIL